MLVDGSYKNGEKRKKNNIKKKPTTTLQNGVILEKETFWHLANKMRRLIGFFFELSKKKTKCIKITLRKNKENALFISNERISTI